MSSKVFSIGTAGDKKLLESPGDKIYLAASGFTAGIKLLKNTTSGLMVVKSDYNKVYAVDNT